MKEDKIKVTDITEEGVSLDIKGEAHIMLYKDFPWLRRVTAEELGNIVLRWDDEVVSPDLEVELGLDTLVHPENYPLVMDPTLKMLDTLPRRSGLIETLKASKECLREDLAEGIEPLREIFTKLDGLYSEHSEIPVSPMSEILKQYSISRRSEIKPEKHILDLTLRTEGGRLKLLNSEGKWVDVTDQWSGKEKEN